MSSLHLCSIIYFLLGETIYTTFYAFVNYKCILQRKVEQKPYHRVSSGCLGWRKRKYAINTTLASCKLAKGMTRNSPRSTCYIRSLTVTPSFFEEAAWPSGQGAGLEIWRSWVQVPLWPLTGFVPSRPWLNSSAALVNSQLVCLLPVGILNLLSLCQSGVPVN